MEVRVYGYELTLRLADAERIGVVPASEYIPQQKAGVTVEKKDGEILDQPGTIITDLPGIYSMSPYTTEELVSRDFLLNTRPNGIINIVDATNIDRNLYLTMQLLELDIPMVIALNMMDEVAGNGGSVDVKGMEAMLGVPVVPISAMKNQGVQELIEKAIYVARRQVKPAGLQQELMAANTQPVDRCQRVLAYLMEDKQQMTGLSARFAAGKLIEGDERIIERLDYSRICLHRESRP